MIQQRQKQRSQRIWGPTKPPVAKASWLKRLAYWLATFSLWDTGACREPTSHKLMKCNGYPHPWGWWGPLANPILVTRGQGQQQPEQSEISFSMQRCEAGRGPHWDLLAEHQPNECVKIDLGLARSEIASSEPTYNMFFKKLFKVASRGPRWELLTDLDWADTQARSPPTPPCALQ